jgi:hypothetical protein
MRVLIALLVIPAFAAAEPTKDVGAMHTDDCAKARKANKTCVLDMGKEAIESERPHKPTDDIVVPKFDKHASLIRERHEFILEILKSAEDL